MKNRVYLYPSDVTEQAFFGTPGFGALTALSARVTEDLLAPFACQATVVVPVDDSLAAYVTAGAVLGIPCVDGLEPFRITRTRKTLATITAECWHITQDLRDGLIENRAWEDKQLSEVWEDILQAGGHTMFRGASSIDRVESVRIVRRSVWEAIVGDQDNSVLSRWGGEVSRSGWSVNIQDRRGQDRDWQIRYGHNLTGINDDVDVSDVIHAVLPTYTLSDTAVHTMAVQYCPGYSTLDRPRTVSIHYSNIAETESEAEQIIADRIQLMWTQKAHLPRASCVVEFLDLARVGVALPWSEDVRIGDRIRAVWVGHVDIDQRVVRTEWDALAQKWERIVLGQPERSLVALTGLIDEQFGVVRNQLDGVLSSSIGATLLLNEAYANALGYYQTDRRNEATGAIITYIHDEPLLEDSVWIATMPEPGTYLWTDQGWNDGDPVWTQGLSNDGNMVIRLLTADLITTGLLRAVNGGAWFDLDKPEIVMEGEQADLSITPENPLKLTDKNGNFIGGLGVADGRLGLVAGVLTNDPNMDTYATIGYSAEGGRGVAIYEKNYPNVYLGRLGAEPFGIAIDHQRRLLIGDNIFLNDKNGQPRLRISTLNTYLIDKNNTHRLVILDADFGNGNTSLHNAANSHAIGVDNTGPYYTKNGVKYTANSGMQTVTQTATTGTVQFGDSYGIGVVRIEHSTLTNALAAYGSVSIFTLPEWCRPIAELWEPIQFDNHDAAAVLRIHANGSVQIHSRQSNPIPTSIGFRTSIVFPIV